MSEIFLENVLLLMWCVVVVLCYLLLWMRVGNVLFLMWCVLLGE